MDEYKGKFEIEHNRKWVFQCEATEIEYVTHISKLDPQFKEDLNKVTESD